MAITAGSKLPAPPASVWEGKPEASVTFPSTGKFLLVGVPGAFTPPCSSHVPGYVQNYDDFASKGISDIYVVSINDVFVATAWKKSFDEKSKVHFIADSTGEYVKTLGLTFDATGLLGGTRAQRFVAVVENGVIKTLEVEDKAPNVTVTASDAVLKKL